MVTHKRLVELLSYDPETGSFKWKFPRRGVPIDRPVGKIHPEGYRIIGIDGRHYYASRLAFFYMHERWPANEVDHINRDRADDRIANLREATRAQNACNTRLRRTNTSGARGVVRRNNRWQAAISINSNRSQFLGSFPTLEEASCAYEEAARQRYGEFFAADQLQGPTPIRHT